MQPMHHRPTHNSLTPATPNNGIPANYNQWQPQPQPQPGMYQAQPGAGGMAPAAYGHPNVPAGNTGDNSQDLFTGVGAKMALDYGQKFVQNKVMPSVFRAVTIDQLRDYFHVSNSYVLQKFKVILLPFLHRNWKREQYDSPEMAGRFKLPRDDINAPDLYIPTMAFVTYILLYGLALGVHHRFSPEILGVTASTALVTLFLEVIAMKFVFYMLGDVVAPPPLFDLIAYSSYKYVCLIVDLLFGILFGSFILSLATFITGCCFALFMSRTLNKVTSAGLPAATLPSEEQSKKTYFLLGLAALQILIAFFLVRNAVPSD